MDIYDVVENQRAALLKREYRTVKGIVRAYEIAERRVEASIRHFQAKIKAAQDAGLEPSLAWYYQEARLENVLREIRMHLDEFSKDALEFAESGRDDAYELGAVHALRLAEAQVYGDIAGLNAGAFANAQALLSATSPLKVLFDEIGPTAAVKAREVFAQGIAEGWNPRKMGRVLSNEIEGLSKRRAVLIARTEQIRAYRTANRDVYKRNTDVLRGWRWTAAKTPATCAMCLALDGEIFPVDQPLSSHPACVVGDTKVATPRLLASTARRYSGEVVEIKTRNGHVLTVTPNHPVLTPDGYVAAGLLREGGYVVSGSDPKRAMEAIDPNYNDVPSKAEEVARLSRELPDVTRRLMPASAENFHGDGESGEVDIILINSKLRNEHLSSLPKEIVENPFSDGAFTDFLARNGGLTKSLVTHLRPPVPSVGGPTISEMFLGGSAGRREAVSVSLTANLDSGREKTATDNASAYSETFGEGILARSGLISADQIVGIERNTFHGWVYNFETATGWYIANGIVIHNCRCSMTPLPKTDFGGPQPTLGEDYFAKLSDEEQDRILGKGKATLYREGKITLKDNVHWKDSPEWGRQPSPRPLSWLRDRHASKSLPSQRGFLKVSPFEPIPARKLSDLLTEAERKANDPKKKALDAWEKVPAYSSGDKKPTFKTVKDAPYKKLAKKFDGLDSTIEEVDLGSLVSTVRWIGDDKVRAAIQNLGDGPDLPVVFRQGSTLYIHNSKGLARLQAKVMLGQTKASVRIFDADL